jgi:hypothetical protein
MEVYHPESDYTGLQTSRAHEDPERVPEVPEQRLPQVYEKPELASKICGLKPTTFWLSLALALVLVAAVVGGTVGGVVGSRRIGSVVSRLELK